MKYRLGEKARKAIGARLKNLRTENSIKQTDLAKSFRLSQAMIVTIEQGRGEPSIVMTRNVMQKFNVSSDWFLFGKDYGKSKTEPKEKPKTKSKPNIKENEDD